MTPHRPKPPLDERLHRVLVRAWGLRAIGLDSDDFGFQIVARVMTALNAARLPRPPLSGEPLWLTPPVAFTGPGRYVYISRRFLERCRSDAPAAFALAHEIAHHDLGHLDHVERWLAAGRYAPAQLVLTLLQELERRLYSHDNELAADAAALDLCARAGYPADDCLQAFDILGEYLLNCHDDAQVYGEESAELDPQLAANPVDRTWIELRLWRARHRRSHPSLAQRREALQARSRRPVRG